MLILLIKYIFLNYLLGHGLIIEKLKFLQVKLENKEIYWGVQISSENKLLAKISAILDDAKTESISIINLKNKTSIADFFVIATCRSSRHTDATANEIIRILKKIGIKCPNPSGRPQCDWVIVDAGEVIIHLFRQEIRELYNLENLWGMNFESVENKTA